MPTPSNQSATYKDLTKPTQTKSFQLALRILNQWGFTLKKVKSLNDLPNGAKVALPDSPYNTTRALRLLESAGLIKLPSDFKDGTGTPSDIVENKKKS